MFYICIAISCYYPINNANSFIFPIFYMYNILVCTVFLRSAEESIPPTSVSYFATYDSTYTVNVTNTKKKIAMNVRKNNCVLSIEPCVIMFFLNGQQ